MAKLLNRTLFSFSHQLHLRPSSLLQRTPLRNSLFLRYESSESSESKPGFFGRMKESFTKGVEKRQINKILEQFEEEHDFEGSFFLSFCLSNIDFNVIFLIINLII